MKKWNKCIKIVIYLSIIIISILSYRIWLNLYYRIMNIVNPFHSSLVDDDKGFVVKFSKIYGFVKGHLLSGLKIFTSKRRFVAWLAGIPGWLSNLILKLLWIIYYLVNFISILIILGLMLSITSNKKFRVSKAALILVKLKNKLLKCLRRSIYEIKGFCHVHKKDIKRYIFIYLFLSGIMEYIIVEILLYFTSYFIYVLTLESYSFLLSTFKFIIVKWISLYYGRFRVIAIIGTILIVGRVIESLSLGKLRKMFEKFKCFIKYDTATVNIWNGAPGSHKTNSIVQAALASTENFIDDLEEEIFNFELEYPDFNMSYIRLIAKIRYDDISIDELKEILKDVENDFLVDLIELMNYIPLNTMADDYFKLYYRGSFTASSIGILDPYYHTKEGIGYTHYLDFDSIRFYKKQENMFHESYENLVIPEFDKEYGSNDTDTKKNASDDGAPAFFAMFSHLVKRNGKIFLDWQDKTQALRRFRAVSGFFAFNKKAKFSYAGFIKIFRKPIEWLYNINCFFMKLYLGSKKSLDKWTVRTDTFNYKRNDVSFIYQLMKYYGHILYRILGYFEHFAYFKVWCQISYDDEGSDKHIVKYYIPLCNMYYKGNKVYESCQFNKFYQDIKDIYGIDKKGLQNLGYWSSIDPSAEEYVLGVKQRFYTKVIKAQMENETFEKEDDGDDVL